jgi:arsenate reductase
MAAAWLTRLAGDRIEVRSAGSAPADAANPAVVRAMAEIGMGRFVETKALQS